MPPRHGGELRQLCIYVLLRAGAIAASVWIVDLMSTSLSVPALAEFSINRSFQDDRPPLGERIITFLLSYVGVLPAVLVAITSLGVTTLSAYASPSLLLLKPHYRYRGWGWLVRIFVGKSNRFTRALITSLGLSASLLVLAGSRTAHLTENHLPAVALVVVLALLTLGFALVFVFWAIDLRRPSQAVFHTYLLARDLLDGLVARGPTGALSRQRWSGVRSPYECIYDEQETLKRCGYALTEAAIRALTDRQRFTAREAVAALRELAAAYLNGRTRLPAEWHRLQDSADERYEPAWFLQLIVESFESILIAACDLRYFSVADDSGKQLRALTRYLAYRIDICPPPARALRRALKANESALDECIDVRDSVTLRALAPHAVSAIASATRSGRLAGHWAALVQRRFLRAALRAVETDDVVALRVILRAYRRILSRRRTCRTMVLGAVFDLGGTALAARAYRASSILIDWFVPNEPPAQDFIDAITDGTDHSERGLPDYVTEDYEQLFTLLTAARIGQLAHVFDSDTAARIHARVESLRNARRRASFVCRRMTRIVAYPEAETDAWLEQVAYFLIPRTI